MKIQAKRRKDKYNPYKIRSDDKFLIEFKDVNGADNVIEVSKEIYNVFNEFELLDLSQMNKFDRHIEHIHLEENLLHKKMIKNYMDVENIVIGKLEQQELHKLIYNLTKIQQRRIIMYFFRNMTLKEISKKEKCSIRAIQYSIKNALKNLKKFFE